MKKKTLRATPCLAPQTTFSEHANEGRVPAGPGKASGVGFRELSHRALVRSGQANTHCNTLFALL